jgi:hypothetical protein
MLWPIVDPFAGHAGGRSTERWGQQYKLRSGLRPYRQVSPPHKSARLRWGQAWSAWAGGQIGLHAIGQLLPDNPTRRRGWAMRDHMQVELPSAALAMAINQQRPQHGLIGGFKRSSQHLKLEVAMKVVSRRSGRSGRAPLPSPGRPSAAGRDEQNRFWKAIATGQSSEDAAFEAGLSQPVGSRLFRQAGGMPPAMFRSSAKPLSGRYLSLAEREEIALLKVQGHSIREIGRRLGRAASTVSRELRRNAASRRSFG